MNKELDRVWVEIELQRKTENGCLQRMVCVDHLYRIYAGVEGIPAKRFVSIEIPYDQRDKIEEYSSPQGFSILLSEPVVRHKGYSSCVLQSNSSDLNDVFSIVATDILLELRTNTSEEEYVKTLTTRIEKWKDFFKNAGKRGISETTEIGLYGELLFLKELFERKLNYGLEMWNGPLKSAQDFQADSLAVEIKTVISHSIEKVIISSEEQLDLDKRTDLFLGVYRLERNDVNGMTLPKLIRKLENFMSEEQARYFRAYLFCIGYREEDESKYKRAFSVKEMKLFNVIDDFPRLINSNIPKGISKTKYTLDLKCCENYLIDSEIVYGKIREIGNG